MPMSGSKEKRRDCMPTAFCASLTLTLALTCVNTAGECGGGAQVTQTRDKLDGNRTLVEILMRIAHVGIFRLVTDLRRKFRIAGMNVWDIRWKNGVIAVPPYGKRKR